MSSLVSSSRFFSNEFRAPAIWLVTNGSIPVKLKYVEAFKIFSSVFLTFSGHKFHKKLYESNVIMLGELEPIHPDVLVESGYPGHQPWSQLPQGDGSAQISFDVSKPLCRFFVNIT